MKYKISRKQNMKMICLLVFVGLFGFLCSPQLRKEYGVIPAQAKSVYIWEDSSGVTHISETKPEQEQNMRILTATEVQEEQENADGKETSSPEERIGTTELQFSLQKLENDILRAKRTGNQQAAELLKKNLEYLKQKSLAKTTEAELPSNR